MAALKVGRVEHDLMEILVILKCDGRFFHEELGWDLCGDPVAVRKVETGLIIELIEDLRLFLLVELFTLLFRSYIIKAVFVVAFFIIFLEKLLVLLHYHGVIGGFVS